MIFRILPHFLSHKLIIRESYTRDLVTQGNIRCNNWSAGTIQMKLHVRFLIEESCPVGSFQDQTLEYPKA